MPRLPPQKPPFPLPLRVAGWYLLFSALWIIGTDQIISLLFDQPHLIQEAQTAKGLLFVALSAALVYWIIHRDQLHSQAMQEELHMLSLAVEQSANSVIITNAEGVIEYVNTAFCDITGYSRKEIAGQHTRILKSGGAPAETYRKLWETIQSGQDWHGEFHNRKKDGSLYWCIESISPIRGHDGRITHFVAVAEDVSERSYATSTIKHLAYYDTLTHLPNRTLFRDRLLHALSVARHENSAVALLLLDIDRFKTINDTLGHDIGNQLLQSISSRMMEGIRHENTLARLGDDEFGIILTGIENQEMAASQAEMVFEILRQPFDVEGREIFLTASIGGSLFPDDGNDPDSLVKNAGVALQRAKDEGRNNLRFFTHGMNALMVEHLRLATSLHHALEREEFRLLYQPQVDIASGRICGVEALIRWELPGDGLISPAQFIPLAEENGLIVPIGEWALRTACMQAKAWSDAGLPPLRVAVNLSARQFRQTQLASTLIHLLESTGLQPEQLELEITESLIMQHTQDNIITLEALHRTGVSISVDDFGTGYSSLSYLKRFPIQMLKIDQSFVRDITHDPEDTAIVSAIITLAHSLNLKVIAEGVETSEQLAMLQQLGCDSYQGYLFSRPITPESLETLLKENSASTLQPVL